MIIDISQTLFPDSPVWPGDVSFETFQTMQLSQGDSVNVGAVKMSLHTGTHVDAPRHFTNEGAAIDAVDLAPYIGTALVVDLTLGDRSNLLSGIPLSHLDAIKEGQANRILFKTGTGSNREFPDRFAHLSEEAASELTRTGIQLVGIDTPSVDRVDAKSLVVHQILNAANIAILENLRLDSVAGGIYELIALPLKLSGMDASPVRAILRTPPE
ncbi:MAG: cyclase family protein [candidate division Zixibacteria bacterium]